MPHTVESLTGSIHLSIGFVRLTLCDAMIAAIDLFSDLNRPLRTAVLSGGTGRGEALARQVAAVLTELARACDARFMTAATDLRVARTIVDLPKLAPVAPGTAITAATRVRHTPLAVAHLTGTAQVIDFCQPGSHIAVHRGVEQSLIASGFMEPC